MKRNPWIIFCKEGPLKATPFDPEEGSLLRRRLVYVYDPTLTVSLGSRHAADLIYCRQGDQFEILKACKDLSWTNPVSQRQMFQFVLHSRLRHPDPSKRALKPYDLENLGITDLKTLNDLAGRSLTPQQKVYLFTKGPESPDSTLNYLLSKKGV